ncbi:MAG TPA: acid phosphatase [Thermoanaerobaculia bacterium]|jgi:acid phosphatase|nr:acid phosphatase [Thermoanaerobaculia bacterium]
MNRLRFLAILVSLRGAHAAAAVDSPRTVGGVVAGDGYYQNALVCLDANRNARCESRERHTRTAADGSFTLEGRGPVVAEIGPDAILIDPATGTTQPVTDRLTLRAPAQATGVVSPISTELIALMDARHGHSDRAFHAALASLEGRLGLDEEQVLSDPNRADDPVRATLRNENDGLVDRIAAAVAESGRSASRVRSLRNRLALDDIRTVVVIYAENRSFDNLLGLFPGANGLREARRNPIPQKDRDGSVLPMLPPAWTGLTAPGQSVTVTQAETTNVLPNAPFQIDDPLHRYFRTASRKVVTRDLYHRFFENQMQIAGGANDGFAAWADSGGLVMGYYDGRQSALWRLARRYTLADNFFQGAFGGSFLNHQYLVCACAPEYPNADTSPAKPSLTTLDTDDGGRYLPRLTVASTSKPSALDAIPTFALSGNIAPKDYFGDGTFRAVNTMQPPYQPSANKPAKTDETRLYADPSAATTLPPQTAPHIGDLLDAKGLSWAWYAGAWNQVLALTTANPYSPPPQSGPGTSNPPPVVPTFQFHHQPFNFFAGFDPVARADARAAHLKDYEDLVAAAKAGTLPAVTFYKPQGNLNEHAGYSNVADGDAHIAGVIRTLQASAQWKHMLVFLVYDENGGWWDHVAPPHGDLLGPGSRIPAVVVSPFAKRSFVDHTQYDTGSIARFLAHRWSLPLLPGVKRRDDALTAGGGRRMGDLTNALDFGP